MYLKDKLFRLKKYLLNERSQLNWQKNIDKKYIKLKKKKKIILIVQQGRCGSRWLLNIFKSHKKEFTGDTTRDKLIESFYHFCEYNKIRVDHKPLIVNLKNRILQDWKEASASIICSPYFIFNLEKIINEIKPDKIILCINDPVFTANSFFNKNIYNEELVYSKNLNILGLQQFQYNDISRYFGRIVPKGKSFYKWIKLGRLAKIGWYMNETMKSLYKTLKKTKKKIYIFNLNKSDQNYEFYLSLRKKFQIKQKLSKKNFFNLKKTKATINYSNDLTFNNYDQSKWSKKDKKDFIQKTKFFRKFYLSTKNFLKLGEKII